MSGDYDRAVAEAEAKAEDTEAETRTPGTTKRQIAPLLARRRQNLDRDGHITEERYDYHRSGDGHKIRKIVTEDKETGRDEQTFDLSALEGAAPSTTSNIEILEIEAKQADEATAEELERMNPHIPSNDDVLRAILDHLRPMDLTPAWEVCDDE